MNGDINYRCTIAATLMVAVVMFSSGNAQADYLGSAIAKRQWLEPNGLIFFGTNVPGTNTCDYYRAYYKFDSTTPVGKNMLATLMLAQATNRKIDIWYGASPTPGADWTNGCSPSSLSVVTGIGISLVP